jgi:hypothetical protein
LEVGDEPERRALVTASLHQGRRLRRGPRGAASGPTIDDRRHLANGSGIDQLAHRDDDVEPTLNHHQHLRCQQ